MATDRWQYAYRSVLEEDVKRRLYMWSWERMKKHRLAREGERGGGREGEGWGRGRREGTCVYSSWYIIIEQCVKNT